jgi:hypothetical protein
MMNPILALAAIVSLMTSCDGPNRQSQSNPVTSQNNYPEKIAYCRIPSELVSQYSELGDDYFWLIRDSDFTAGLAVVSRGKDIALSTTRFTVENLNLNVAGNQYSGIVTDRTFGIAPMTGALSLTVDQQLFFVDLDQGLGKIEQIDGYNYFGGLSCVRFSGQTPY